MKTYVVQPTLESHPSRFRFPQTWVLLIEGVGVTQCAFLSNAEATVRDYILTTDPDAEKFDVEILDPVW